MDDNNLINNLIQSLEKVYYMDGFTQLTDFLQGEHYILHYLSQNLDNEISPSTLSAKLHMTRPRVTAVINTLKKKNYVEAKQDEEDRRRLSVRITEEGLDFINSKQKNAIDYFQFFIESVGDENVKELIRIIELAVDKMDDQSNSRGQ